MKEEVLEIIESLPEQKEALDNLDTLYRKEANNDTQVQLVTNEIKNLSTPIDLIEITERCEDLERILKVVNC